jgi:mannose-6-phosphate isomerase-like protein (cupin superfamily)
MTTAPAAPAPAAITASPIADRTIALQGSRMRVLATGAETGGAFTLLENTLQPGMAPPPLHVHHQQDEVTFVLQGALRCQLGDRTIVLGPGEHLVRPRGVPHTVGNAGTTPVTFLEISTPAGIEVYFAQLGALLSAANTPSAPGAPSTSRTMADLMPAVGALAAQYGIEMPSGPSG